VRCFVDQSEVFFLSRPLGELRNEGVVGFVGLGQDNHARGFTVEAMDDARTRCAAGRSQFSFGVMEQSVYDGNFIRTLHGVREQTGGFVDRNQVSVFEENFEGHLDGASGWLARRGEGDFDMVARFDDSATVGGDAVDLDHPEVEGFLHPRTTDPVQ
jgi:hypothetical protein